MEDHDAWMVEPRDRPRLAFETSQPIGVARESLGEHLERHVAPQSRVPRAVNVAHPSRSEKGHDLVRAETRARIERHAANVAHVDSLPGSRAPPAGAAVGVYSTLAAMTPTPYTIQLQRLPSIPLAVIRRQARRSDLARVVPECCGLVWDALRAQGTRGGRHVAVYLDDAIRLEVGVEALAPFAEQGEVVRSATPAGLAATITHFGPYASLGIAHHAVREWCRANQHALAGPNWEVFGHWQPEWNAHPAQIRTDVFYQIAGA